MKFRNHHAGCCGFNPTRSDGSEWGHILTLPDGSTVHADTAAEAVEELIAGYTALDAAGRLSARVAKAEAWARDNQDERIEDAGRRGLMDPADAGQRALVDVMRADKGLSLLLEVDEAPAEQAPWVLLPELVLVTTSYAPHTDYPPIPGNVVWLDPTDDQRFLASLQDAGILNYWSA